MSDWWSRKMGGGDSPPPPQRSGPWPHVPTAAPPRPPDQVAMPTVPPAYMPGVEQQLPQTENGEVSAAIAIRSWRGGDGTKKETSRCPNCHGPNFFSRAFNENGMPRRGPEPAPECFDCGYPLVQAGSSAGALAAAPVQGPAQRAQQPPPPPPPLGSVGSITRYE